MNNSNKTTKKTAASVVEAITLPSKFAVLAGRAVEFADRYNANIKASLLTESKLVRTTLKRAVAVAEAAALGPVTFTEIEKINNNFTNKLIKHSNALTTLFDQRTILFASYGEAVNLDNIPDDVVIFCDATLDISDVSSHFLSPVPVEAFHDLTDAEISSIVAGSKNPERQSDAEILAMTKAFGQTLKKYIKQKQKQIRAIAKGKEKKYARATKKVAKLTAEILG